MMQNDECMPCSSAWVKAYYSCVRSGILQLEQYLSSEDASQICKYQCTGHHSLGWADLVVPCRFEVS